MRKLTLSKKIDLIRSLCENHKITAYEIGEKTGLDSSGIQRILNGETKKPRETTLNTILKFLNQKVDNENYPELSSADFVVEEPSFEYGSLGNVEKLIIELANTIQRDHEVFTMALTETLSNTQILKKGNVQISNNLQRLIEVINRNRE